MADERRFADADSMRPVVRAVFGGHRRLQRVERLASGSKKGAYRLTMDEGVTVLVYVWDDSEDYWQAVLPEGAVHPADPFSHASGLALFEAAANRQAAGAQGRLEESLTSLADPIQPRTAVALVHGELGPDHVLLDRLGEPVLIDIEGAMYFDVEVEHVWMCMRFGGHYAKLTQDGLDEDRLRFYQLCMHLDLVAGPLRIAGTSHPEREWFRSVAEHHLERALQFRA